MRKFTLLHKSNDEDTRIPGLKSRITPSLPLLCLLLMLIFGGWNNVAWGGNPIYDNGYWYSVCDGTAYEKSTASVTGVTLHTYSNAFIPNAGTFTFESKLPGNGDSGKESSSNDPHDYGVEAYNITFGGKSVSVPINATTTEVEKSGKGSFLNPYRWTFYYAYNYQEVQGSGLNTESASFEAKYEYKLKNTLRTVYIRNVKVPVGRHIRLADNGNGTTSITNVSLPATSYGGTSSTAYHINLRSFYVEGTSIKYESSNSEFHFGSGSTIANGKASISKTVKANSCAFIGGTANCESTASELGNPDYQEVDVYFTPSSNKKGSSTATITIYDGTKARATITLTAKVIPTYYFKATSVATNGTQTLDIPVKASFTEGSYAGATQTVSQTAADADVASLTKKAYFYAPASSGDYQFQGWYTTADCSGTRVSTDNTISYDIASSAVNSATATEKKYYALYLPIITAEFTGSDQTLKVDGTYNGIGYTRTSAATASTNSTDKFWYEIIIDSKTSVTAGSSDANKVISYDPTTKTVTAINAGTARLVFHQEATGYYVDVDKTYTFIVEKYATSISGGTQYNLKVEDAQAITNYSVSNISQNVPDSGATNHEFYYTIEHSLPANAVVTGSAHPTEVIGYDPSAHKITAYNAGSAVLKIAQKQTYNYTGDTVTYNVTVTKNDNEFKYSWNGGANKTTGWSETMNFDEEFAFAYSTNNTITSLDFNQTEGNVPGNVIASYINNKIKAYGNDGVAKWTLHQDENYKYMGADATLTVTVDTKTCPTCYAYKNDPNKEASEVNEVGWDINGIANVLTFDMKKKGTSFGDNALLSWWITDHYTTPIEVTADNLSNYKPSNPSSIQLDPHTTKLKFEKGGDWIHTFAGDIRSDDPYINNIRVTRLSWLELNNSQTGAAIVDTIKIIKELGEANKQATFQVKISTCDNTVKLASSDSKVVVGSTSIALPSSSSYDGGYLNQDITLTYYCDHKDTTDAVISVYTKYEHNSFVVRAITKANGQEIVWKSGYENDEVTLPVNTQLSISDAASASSKLTPVLYSTNNPSVILISDDRESFKVIASGIATLTASQAGNSIYEATSDTKTIKATEKQIQEIVWTRSFSHGLVIDDTIPLDAYVDTINAATSSRARSDAQTAKLVYSCPNANGVIEIIEGNKVHILGEGRTQITASVASDEHYEATSYTKSVYVRKPSSGCETHYTYLQKDEEILFFEFDFNVPELNYVITLDPDSGVPDLLSFSVRGEYYKAGAEWYRGHVDAYQSSDGANWSYITTIEPEKGQTLSESDLPIDRNTTMIKFTRPSSSWGYHYVEDIVVTRKQYLETASEIIDLGDVPVGSVRAGKIPISYSEMKTDLLITKGLVDETYNKLELDEPSVEIECGSFGTHDVDFKLKPTHVDDSWSQTVTIEDTISKKSITVTLVANIVQGSQSINWTTNSTINDAQDAPRLNATATSGLPVSYVLTCENNVASIENIGGKDTVMIHRPGSFTITASQAGDANYLAAPNIVKNFTVSNVTYVFNGNGDWNTNSYWNTGEKPADGVDVIINGNVTISGEVSVNSMTINEGNAVTLTVGGQLTVGDGNSQDREHYGNLHVKNDGKVILGSGILKVKDFILDAQLGDVAEAQQGASGQVTNPSSLNVNGEVYFDLTLNPDLNGVATFGWYEFTVPFEVNVSNGIYRLNDNGTTTAYQANRDFILARYDEARRASGQKGWVQMNSGVLHAGEAYTIGVDDEVPQNVLRFVWNKNNSVGASNTCSIARSANGDDRSRGWNGLGNGTLIHRQINSLPAETKVQMYDHEANAYIPVNADGFTYAVGTAFFYHALSDDAIVLAQADGERPIRAPRREGRKVSEFFLTLKAENSNRLSDVLYVSASEEATGAYVLGHDLLKMSSPKEASSAQMWAKNADMQLCDIEMPLINNKATCDLGMYAPKGNAYVLSVEQAPQDADLYLTYNGQIIWELTASPYVFDLAKGSTEGYGLRIEARAPQITTGVENTAAGKSVRKVLVNDQIYIITQEGAIYDVLGKSVKF